MELKILNNDFEAVKQYHEELSNEINNKKTKISKLTKIIKNKTTIQ
jgi:hypothetical protein